MYNFRALRLIWTSPQATGRFKGFGFVVFEEVCGIIENKKMIIKIQYTMMANL